MILGTCSICGGPVFVPDYWLCIFPPTPTCQHCGAIKKGTSWTNNSNETY